MTYRLPKARGILLFSRRPIKKNLEKAIAKTNGGDELNEH
jgi:hypothetical protein